MQYNRHTLTHTPTQIHTSTHTLHDAAPPQYKQSARPGPNQLRGPSQARRDQRKRCDDSCGAREQEVMI